MNNFDQLLADLQHGEETTTLNRSCQACDALREVPDEAYDALRRALAGTIGVERLSKICRDNGLKVGRRAIEHHREEDHS